jgi:hypothetical protein
MACLSEIHSKVELRLRQIDKRLAQLPESSKHAFHECNKIIQNYAQVVQLKTALEEQKDIANNIRVYATQRIDMFKSHIIQELLPKLTVTADLGTFKRKAGDCINTAFE